MDDVPLETILAARADDQAAIRAIIDHLHRPMLATIRRFLGERFRGEVEDVAQEVFVKIFRAIHRFDPQRGVKFTTWTYSFVRNHCFDFLRKRRVSTQSLSSTREEDEQIVVRDESARRPIAELENVELGERIDEALAGISARQRAVFILREYEGMDYAAIASAMHVPEGTVKSRLHRAKAELRSRLEPYLRGAKCVG